MMNTLLQKFSIILLICLFCSPSATSQQIVSENDMSFEILKWHFHHYPQSETTQWEDLGEGLYRVAFTFEDKDIKTTYNNEGIRLKEVVDLSKEVPVSIAYYLEERHEKFKIRDFLKLTDFEEEETIHVLTAKTKNRGEIEIRFDAHLVPMDNQLLTTLD